MSLDFEASSVTVNEVKKVLKAMSKRKTDDDLTKASSADEFTLDELALKYTNFFHSRSS